MGYISDQQRLQIIEIQKELAKLDDAAILKSAMNSEGGRLADRHLESKRQTHGLGIGEIEIYRAGGGWCLHTNEWDQLYGLEPLDIQYYVIWLDHCLGIPFRRGDEFNMFTGEPGSIWDPEYQRLMRIESERQHAEYDRKQEALRGFMPKP
jgi:hypothetical protein